MITLEQKQALQKAYASALAGGHIWPAYAACEAMDESAWGTSKLAVQANNLFGQKYPHGVVVPYPMVTIPTREFDKTKGGWYTEPNALWVKFPDWATAFKERMALLRRLPAYSPALKAQTGEEFITEVSKVWSTDPNRANLVLQIYKAHKNDLTLS